MSMQFSLAHLTVIGCPPPEMTYLAARAGYDYVSLRLIPMGLAGEHAYLPHDKEMIRKTKMALTETGLGVWDLELARILPEMDAREYLPAMEVAAELGARHVISSAWTNDINDRDYVVERFGEICDLARPLGLTVNLEFPSFSRLKNLSQTIDIVKGANRPNAGILLDTLYIYFSRVSTEDLQNLPREWIHFVHLCDTDSAIPDTREDMIHIARDNRLYPGEGIIDFDSIFHALPPVTCSIELPNQARVREFGYEEHARRCLEAARRVLCHNNFCADSASKHMHGSHHGMHF